MVFCCYGYLIKVVEMFVQQFLYFSVSFRVLELPLLRSSLTVLNLIHQIFFCIDLILIEFREVVFHKSATSDSVVIF